MIKILVLNEYPLDRFYEDWKNGLTPSQQLWGKVELDQLEDFEVIILPHVKYKWLNTLGDLFKIQHLDQQIRTLGKLNKIDIIYAPFAAATTKLLILLKFLKIISTPIVINIHYPLLGSDSDKKIVKKIGKRIFSCYDGMLFLSKNIAFNLTNGFNLDEQVKEKKIHLVKWGADVKFYQKYIPARKPSETKFIISTGQTARDFDTLIEAFRDINFPLKIYCTPNTAPTSKDIPEHIEVIPAGKISTKDLLEQYDAARMILVSYRMVQDSTVGLTSLLDGLAMAKPVLMTKNDNIDINLEKEGIGFFVKEGDPLDWKQKILSILHDEELLENMGRNAYRVFKEQYNSINFGKELETIMRNVHQNSKK